MGVDGSKRFRTLDALHGELPNVTRESACLPQCAIAAEPVCPCLDFPPPQDFEAQAYGVLWEPEPVVLQCRACFKQFGFFRRKHHCRCCGMAVAYC